MQSDYPNRRTTRLPFYDYRRAAWYYITICTHQREHFFGAVIEEKMNLSEIGKIAESFWSETPKHFTNTSLDEYVVMPNHIHGIIVIDVDNESKTTDVACNVPTAMSKISPKSGSLSTIIRSFKSACTKKINICLPDAEFGWQSRFYEHVIRDEEDLERIRQYIRENPANWERDELNIKI